MWGVPSGARSRVRSNAVQHRSPLAASLLNFERAAAAEPGPPDPATNRHERAFEAAFSRDSGGNRASVAAGLSAIWLAATWPYGENDAVRTRTCPIGQLSITGRLTALEDGSLPTGNTY